jgi:predicted transposase YbfD/YdcC
MERPELTLVEHFRGVQDYRENHNKVHVLVEMIAVAVCCVICGANNFSEIAVIANEKREWLQTFLVLQHGIPSPDTFNRVFARLNPNELQACFRSWVTATFACDDIGQLAIDGKELHHSQDPDDDFANLRMVSVWSVKHGLVLGQKAVADGSNEITAVPAVIQAIDIAGGHITADALHCQTNLIERITDAQATYTIGVKANQKTLYQDIVDTFATTAPHPNATTQTYATIDKGHGRVETRRYTLTSDLSRLTTGSVWKGVTSIGMVERERQIGDKVEREKHYYIHSGGNDVGTFASAVRSHWQIENGLHWRLDVILNEDNAHIRVNHGPENMAVLRHIALNLLLSEQTMKAGMQSKRLRAACSNMYLEKVMFPSKTTG